MSSQENDKRSPIVNDWSSLIAMISHELRTPLNVVSGYTELMLDGIPGDLNDEQREMIRDIGKSSMQMRALIDDMRDLSNIEMGRLNIIRETLELSELVEESLRRYQRIRNGTNGPIISVKTLSKGVTAYADRNRAIQIITNLLDNAIKFTPTSGSITVTLCRGESEAVIAITDTGIGIEKESLSKIFNPFVQLEQPFGEQKGSGLGLSLCKTMAELMGGTIEVSSVYREGSTFSLKLPLTSGH